MLIQDKDINAELQRRFDSATRAVDIIAYSITRPRKGSSKLFLDTWKSLEMAIKRGIPVRLILETWNDFNPQASENNKVKIALESLGAQVRMGKKGVCVHAKTWCFDKYALVIGSHNSTEAGLCRTKNLSIALENHIAVEQFNTYFEQEWFALTPLKQG
jgi:phosphatidylserine/phosphatidylglycerophosphate/cardiolipin synthase-like enzyme